MAQRGIGDQLELFLVLGDVVPLFRGEAGLGLPGDQVRHQVDDGRAAADGAAERSLAAIAACGVMEHVFREQSVGITDFFFQQAEDPQPGTGASATFFVIGLESFSSCFQRVDLDPGPWQRRSRDRRSLLRRAEICHRPTCQYPTRRDHASRGDEVASGQTTPRSFFP